jgi:thiazole synthase
VWQLADKKLTHRLLLGSALYPSLRVMEEAIKASQAQVVTVSLRRETAALKTQGQTDNKFWHALQQLDCHILPNTAGCYSAKEAINTALMAREVFDTHWLKLEVIGDEYNLQPDPFGLLETTKELISQGFEVLPYCTDDLVLCQRLVELGCRTLMPWGAPIGTGQGLLNPLALKTLRQRLPDINLIVDAGLGAPSHALQAMELGFDGILVDSAVALAQDPIKMARAFSQAVSAGHLACQAGLMTPRDLASPSTPLIGKPFWQQTDD